MKNFGSANELVNLERYPVADLQNDPGRAFAEKCRQQYKERGLCALPDFILSDALEVLAREADAVSHEAYFCNNTHNPYLTDDDPALPDEDIARRQQQTFVGSVPYDRIGADSQLNKLYHWDPLKNFIGYVLGKEKFFRFADPLGACSINVFVDGGEHGWHFDESEFTVTLMLQPPLHGGNFEYVPMIRGLSNEKEIVADVLDGGRKGVVELPFTAGTLLIFGGNQTIHRVTRVEGERARLVPVLCFAEKPDMTNSESVRRLFWGRTGNEVGTKR